MAIQQPTRDPVDPFEAASPEAIARDAAWRMRAGASRGWSGRAERIGSAVGHAVSSVRDTGRGSIKNRAAEMVRKYPASLGIAALAGFLIGRKLRS
jgi:hypothetical protein